MLKDILLRGIVLVLTVFAIPSIARNIVVGCLKKTADSTIVYSLPVVDLGLGVDWTSWNLVAESPEIPDNYCSWCETYPQHQAVSITVQSLEPVKVHPQDTLTGIQRLRNRLKNAIRPSNNVSIQNLNIEADEEMCNMSPNATSVFERYAIDLGLSVRWSSCNLGAETPEEPGDFYAWGELEPKECYDKSTYTHYDIQEDSYIEIGENISGSKYDAARAQMGGIWRIPTDDECEELITKCTWTWIQIDGVDGYKVTGPNGKSIFMPAAGYCVGDEVSVYGSYWTGIPYTGLGFHSEDVYMFSGNRYEGRKIRPVCE